MATINWRGKNNPSYKHGMARTPEYNTWYAMIRRCTNPKCKAFEDYGGRGITVCDKWRDFINFYADMGLRPEGLSIDRINNNGNYEKSNCRWATWSEQANNKREYKIRRDNTTGIKGISWDKQSQKYRIRKTIQGKQISLGYFTDLNKAVNVLKTFNKKKEEVQCMF